MINWEKDSKQFSRIFMLFCGLNLIKNWNWQFVVSERMIIIYLIHIHFLLYYGLNLMFMPVVMTSNMPLFMYELVSALHCKTSSCTNWLFNVETNCYFAEKLFLSLQLYSKFNSNIFVIASCSPFQLEWQFLCLSIMFCVHRYGDCLVHMAML